MSEYTPGPWTRSYTNYIYQGKDTASKGKLIAVCEPTTRTQEDWDQVFANARLIAAAPELYELLDEIVNEAIDYTNRRGKEITWADKAKSVINKIKG